jgi:hypothetical protein
MNEAPRTYHTMKMLQRPIRSIVAIGILALAGPDVLRAADRQRPTPQPQREHPHRQPSFTREEFGRVDRDRNGFVSGEEFEKYFMPLCTYTTCKAEMEKAWKTEYPWQDIKTHVVGADLAMWMKLAKTKGKTWGVSQP